LSDLLVDGATDRSSRLVVIPIHDASNEARMMGAVQLLARVHAWALCSAVLVTWDPRGQLVVAPPIDGSPDRPSAGWSWWCSVLLALFDTPISESTASEAPEPAASLARNEVSVSFRQELKEVVTPGTSFTAVLVDWLDPGLIADEVARIQATRVIYGAVPSKWRAEL
jgi:uncharacterized membrane protein